MESRGLKVLISGRKLVITSEYYCLAAVVSAYDGPSVVL